MSACNDKRKNVGLAFPCQRPLCYEFFQDIFWGKTGSSRVRMVRLNLKQVFIFSCNVNGMLY